MTVTTETDVLYRHLDPHGRLSQTALASYLEHARDAYLEAVVGDWLAEYPRVVANIEIDFEGPIQPDDTVEVAVNAAELGRSSVTIRHEVTTGGKPVATADAVVVFLDGLGGPPAPIPDGPRERIEAHEGQ
jgi:acyl-CoA thioester hydrolase